jgi:RNA polymerase sigma-70 factor (TIGR02960 family)
LADEFRGGVVSQPVMTEATLARARQGDQAAFEELTSPYRRELQVHCYRILGSVQDAEDLLQETLLAAWRGLDQFEQRSTLRAWLYRIATNRCLNALRDSGRRPQEVPMRLDELPKPTRITEPLWLEPYPDSLLEGVPDSMPGPDASYELKESVALALVTGLQHLPPRQRAVFVLREVLGFTAGEVADMLDTSPVSVNSTLQRARATLDQRVAIPRERAPVPSSAAERELITRFAEAFEQGDVDTLVTMLTDDVLITMPPEPLEYEGIDAVAGFLRDRLGAGARERQVVPTRANGQPAFAYYLRDAHASVARNFGVFVITLRGDRIAALTRFADTGFLPHFGLPRTLPA